VIVLKSVHKFIDIPFFKRQHLVLHSFPVDWNYWNSGLRSYETEVTERDLGSKVIKGFEASS
jgi:hypothetical protein